MKVLVLAAAMFVSVIANAQDYTGNYAGRLNGEEATVTVGRIGDVLTASITNATLAACGASIGDMTSMDVDTDNGVTTIDSAEFSFDPGTCDIAGRTIVLDFKHTSGQVSAVQVDLLTAMIRVPGHCIPTHPGGWWCTPEQVRYEYLSGRLLKQ